VIPTEKKSIFARFISKKIEADKQEMTFMDHLEALRWHIVRSAAVWIVAIITIFIKIDWVFDNVISAPARSNFITYSALCKFSHWVHLGEALCMPAVNMELQGNTVSGPFMSALSISMIGGLIVTFPYFIFEIWKFIKPALSPKELKYSRGAIFWVSLCFFVGGAFGYYLLTPFTFNFLANFKLGTTATYIYRPTLDDYIDTINNIILGCGIAFELPIVAYVLGKIGIVSASFLKSKRKYAFVVILVAAAIITPSPDWTSQILVSLPLLLLFEISIIICSKIDKQKAKEEKEWS
jgi:sec-independent protein translocase protein TatC